MSKKFPAPERRVSWRCSCGKLTFAVKEENDEYLIAPHGGPPVGPHDAIECKKGGTLQRASSSTPGDEK